MARVVGVHRSAAHEFSKTPVAEAVLEAGSGVDGDCHSGPRVLHRSRVRRDPDQPNLRQVHLLPAELLEELVAEGYDVAPGSLGENVTTRGVDLLGLATGTTLRLGDGALVAVTGLRNPCSQIDAFSPGLLARLVGRDETGAVVRRAGVMAVVVLGGTVREGDAIDVAPPPGPPVPLAPV